MMPTLARMSLRQQRKNCGDTPGKDRAHAERPTKYAGHPADGTITVELAALRAAVTRARAWADLSTSASGALGNGVVYALPHAWLLAIGGGLFGWAVSGGLAV